MIVADTCLIFHLFNETTLTSLAQKVLDKDPHWIFPPLWREEYANILSKLTRKGFRAVEEVLNHFNATVEDLKNGEIYVDTYQALEISIKHKISVYDAHFVTLAKDFHTSLITDDQEILKNCPDLALSLQDFLSS